MTDDEILEAWRLIEEISINAYVYVKRFTDRWDVVYHQVKVEGMYSEWKKNYEATDTSLLAAVKKVKEMRENPS